MKVVLDTNVLVSALWTPNGNASLLLSLVIAGELQLCYDYRILEEYRDVLGRPKFHFSPYLVRTLLDHLVKSGFSVIAHPLPDAVTGDPDDLPFFEVAKAADAVLVTGNLRHFPDDPAVMSPADFCGRYLGRRGDGIS